jgi:hypothetical protein
MPAWRRPAHNPVCCDAPSNSHNGNSRGSFPWNGDGESSAYEMALYGHSELSDSKPFLEWKKDMIDNPIVLLDATSRIAFVLHNMFGYKVKEAAGMVQISEKEYRMQLRKAYMQLLSSQVSPGLAGDVLGQTALA